MSNEDYTLHIAVKDAIHLTLGPIVIAKKQGRLFMDGGMVTNEEAGVSNNPDASFTKYKSLRSGKVRLIERPNVPGGFLELVGTPDWVLEVISTNSVAKDTERLRVAYHRAGISEYWLIDARGEEIVFTILLWRKSGYVAAPMKDGWQKSKVFGCEFRLTRWRDEFGLWDYTLDVR